VTSVQPPARVFSFQTAPSVIGIGPGSVPYETNRFPSAASTPWLGRYLVGCPGIGFQVAAVVAAEEARASHDRNAGVDRAARLARRAARRIEDHEHDAAATAAAPGGELGLVGRQLEHVGGEGRHLAPGDRAVGALPEAGVARAEEQDAAVVGIDRHPLAVAAPRFVAAELDRHVGARERPPLIGRAEDRPVGDLGRRVRPAGEVDLVRVARIDGDALDAHQVEVGVGDPVEQRLPAVCLGVAPVGAADVGAGVEDVLGGRVEHEPVDEPAAHDLDALPGVGDGRGRGGRRREGGEREQAEGGSRGVHVGAPTDHKFPETCN